MSGFFVAQAFAIFPVVFCALLLVYLAVIIFLKKQSSKQTKLNLLFIFVGLSVVVSVFLAYYMLSIVVSTT